MYEKERKQLTTLLDNIQECLKSENFTNEDKQKLLDMAIEILCMIKIL